jgi:hypothetical protein
LIEGEGIQSMSRSSRSLRNSRHSNRVRGHFILSPTTDPETVWGSCFETLARVASHRSAAHRHGRPSISTAAAREPGRRRQRCAGQTRRSENYPTVDQPVFGFVQASQPGEPSAVRPLARRLPVSRRSSLARLMVTWRRVARPTLCPVSIMRRVAVYHALG